MAATFDIPVAPADRLPREGETIFQRAQTPDYKVDSATGCWIWQKSLLRGYPIAGGTTGKPHRIYWERVHGPIPEGWHLHHTCESTACINPDHLEAMSGDDHFVLHRLHRRGLTLDDVRHIRELGRLANASSEDIGLHYGITGRTVRSYWTGFTWARLLGEEGSVEVAHQKCALPECDNLAVGQRGKRFCCPEHRGRYNHRKRWKRIKARRSVPPSEERVS